MLKIFSNISMQKKSIPIIAIFTSLFLDIISKYIVVQNISLHEKIDFFSGFFRLTLVYNTGGVFGILQGYRKLFLIVSIVVLIFMIIYFIIEKNKSKIFSYSMAFIIGGAIGNIIDRLIPGRPGVVDFISVGVDGVFRWPVFNIADSFIVVGAFLLIVVFYQEEKKRRELEADQ